MQRLVPPAAGNGLNAPWGMAISHHRSGFNKGHVTLLVSNFGDGTIHRFSLAPGSAAGTFSGLAHGALNGLDGKPLIFDGIWGIHFRTIPRPDRLVSLDSDELNEDETVLYFTAGIGDEEHGLFGRIVPR